VRVGVQEVNDDYPPFRFDAGGEEPGPVITPDDDLKTSHAREPETVG
jgi:hypothetical protein